ncbi:protein FAR1-RELATED SEQUENCE 2-like [Rhododendron vialii]|uniref:protein FAR1-RELATED SEQUENCE 2-like n=1 Tax=Rhododendron vialii TaxID=182163 RepID=UPI00265F8771|nr:protein FAR1-RELATED SEQUENCE 2-like [Rhododendron vialii]
MDEEVEDLTTEIEQNENVVNGVKEPKVGMIIDSIDDVVEFYRKYAKEKGFGMSIRTSKKVGGEVRYVTVACNHSGKPRTRGMKVNQLHPQTKTDCKAKITTVILADGKWKLSSFVLNQNHVVSPGKARFHRCHRVLNANVKRKLLVYAKAGVRANKSYTRGSF